VKKKTETVGAAALRLQKKDEKINPIDLQRDIHQGNNPEDSFESQIEEVYNRAIKNCEGDFYIVVLFKKERILQNVVRQYFFYRLSCPTPEFDQVVYKYSRKEDRLEFMWVIPDQHNCEIISQIQYELDPDQRELIKYVKEFRSGVLDRKCAQENKEIVA